MDSFNYRTIQGERWDLIAQKMYGSMSGITTLMEANPSVPADPILPDGTILVIPIVDNTYSATVSTNLPPWKK
jgi:phage tail protein X